MLKRIAVIAACAIAVLAFSGCGQPEKSTNELMLEYLNSEPVNKMYDEYLADINIMIESAKTGDWEQAVDTNAVIYSMCNDVKEMKVDKRCEEIHGKDTEIAENISAMSDAFCDAAMDISLKDTVGATNNVREANEYFKKIEDGINDRTEYVKSLTRNGS